MCHLPGPTWLFRYSRVQEEEEKSLESLAGKRDKCAEAGHCDQHTFPIRIGRHVITPEAHASSLDQSIAVETGRETREGCMSGFLIDHPRLHAALVDRELDVRMEHLLMKQATQASTSFPDRCGTGTSWTNDGPTGCKC